MLGRHSREEVTITEHASVYRKISNNHASSGMNISDCGEEIEHILQYMYSSNTRGAFHICLRTVVHFMFRGAFHGAFHKISMFVAHFT